MENTKKAKNRIVESLKREVIKINQKTGKKDRLCNEFIEVLENEIIMKEIIKKLIKLPWYLLPNQALFNYFLELIKDQISIEIEQIGIPIIESCGELLFNSGKLASLAPKVKIEQVLPIVYNRIVTVMEESFKIAPMLKKIAIKYFQQYFPYYKRSFIDQVWAFKNMILLLKNECFKLYRKDLIKLIISKLTEIDIQVQINDESLIYKMENTPLNVEIEVNEGEKKDIEDHRILIAIIDQGIYDFMEYIDTTEDKIDEIGEDILYSFDKIILKTFKSRYVQFIIFYYVKKSKKMLNDFLRLLILKISPGKYESLSSKSAERLISLSYLGGIITKATFIEDETVKESIITLLKLVEEYMDIQKNNNNENLEQISLLNLDDSCYYSLIQTLLYIICYKHDLLFGINSNSEVKEEIKKRLNRLINLRNNVLSYIYAPIAKGFIKIYVKYQFESITTKLQNFTKIISNRVEENNRIINFFPFNQIFLRLSWTKIEPFYNQLEISN